MNCVDSCVRVLNESCMGEWQTIKSIVEILFLQKAAHPYFFISHEACCPL